MTQDELRYERDAAIKRLEAFDTLAALGPFPAWMVIAHSNQQLWLKELDAEIDQRKRDYERSKPWREAIERYIKDLP